MNPRSHPPFTLRPYQEEALLAVGEAYKRGAHRQLLVMATGLGKTVVVGALAARSQWGPARRFFGLMHREELIEQARATLAAFNPARSIDVEQGERRSRPDADVVLASVQSVARAGGKRLAPFDPDGFSKVWIDEVHHAPADSYKTALRHFGLVDNPGSPKLLLGTTATPARFDKLGYDGLFDDVVFRYGLRDGIQDGWLADLACFRVDTKIDLSGVRIRRGDYVESDLAKAVDVMERNRLCLELYRERAAGRRNLVFCVDRAHARHVAGLFEAAGVPTGLIIQDTPPEERRRALAEFRAGRIHVLVNVTVLTEGIDVPEVEAVHLLRPTKSTTLLLQMIGRGTRKAPGKTRCIVFDYADDFAGKDLLSVGRIFGLPARFDCRGESVLDQVRAVERLEAEIGELPLDDCATLEELRARLRAIDPLKLYAAPPRQVAGSSTMKWWRKGEERYALAWRNRARGEATAASGSAAWVRQTEALLEDQDLWGLRERLEISVNPLGAWEATLFQEGAGKPRPPRRVVREDRRASAVRAAEAWVREHRPHVTALLDATAAWNFEPATPAQLDALARKGYPADRLRGPGDRPALTKGSAAVLLAKPFPAALLAAFRPT